MASGLACRICSGDVTLRVRGRGEPLTAAALSPSAHATGRHGDLLAERLHWVAGGEEAAETYWQRFYGDGDLAGMFAAAGLIVAARRPMYPAIPDAPARGRVLWVATA